MLDANTATMILGGLLLLTIGWGAGSHSGRRAPVFRPRIELQDPPLPRYLVPVQWEHYEQLDQERWPRVRLLKPSDCPRRSEPVDNPAPS